MQFIDYLKAHHATGTVKRYYREVCYFSEWVVYPKTASYTDVMSYIAYLRTKYHRPSTVNCALQALKKYYSYLIHTHQRADHPCKHIYLKDNKQPPIQLQDLFTSSELERILQRKERYALLKHRNWIILSLLIYQALATGDICRLQLGDFDLAAAKIHIVAGAKTNARTLALKPQQILPLYHYIHTDRPKLIKVATDHLIISKLGTIEKGEGITYLIETCRPLFPNRRLNPKTIRQSVIANLLKEGKDLRLVQAFAGHKHPSTTERYQQKGVERLKAEVLKHHPLG